MIQFTEKDNALVFTVKVVPRASKSEIVGEIDSMMKVRIASPPVDGVANAELIKLLSKIFEVSKSNVEIISGETSKIKQIRINGANSKKLAAILQAKN